MDECLYSLTKQDFLDIEVVIKDDHSEDHTELIAKKYEPLFSNRGGYRYIKNEVNKGYRNNIINGVWSCSGKYCMILMDDDFLGARNTISLFVSALEKSNSYSFAYSDTYEYIQGNDSRTPKMIIDAMENINSKYSIIDGKEYFLNFWTKYGPITMSSFMFLQATVAALSPAPQARQVVSDCLRIVERGLQRGRALGQTRIYPVCADLR